MMKRYVRTTLGAAMLAAALAAAGCGVKGEGATASERGGGEPDTALLAAADVAVATTTDLASGIPVSGTLEPGWRARITSPLDDVVREVLVREGQRVARGDVLARFRLDAVETAAASAHAALKSASADYERQKNLLAEGAVSEHDLESAEAAWRAAQAQDAEASRRLADATVRAPADGAVTARSVQSGDRVATGDPLFVVADTRTLELEATVPGDAIARVRPGSPVTLSVAGFGTLTGSVARINATADPATRQVKVYAAVPNANGRLVGDLFASGSIVTERAARALAVPIAAVRRSDRGTEVWIVEGGRLATRAVRTGVVDEAHDRVQVLSGLTAGDRVVTGPIEGLLAGQPVRVGKER